MSRGKGRVRAKSCLQKGAYLEKLEKRIVLRALEMNGWNQARTAKFLQVPRHILIYRIEKYDIQIPEKTDSAE